MISALISDDEVIFPVIFIQLIMDLNQIFCPICFCFDFKPVSGHVI